MKKRDLYELDRLLGDWPNTSELVFFDLEVTSWPGTFERGWSGLSEHREVIEFAAIRLHNDPALEPIKAWAHFVRPLHNPKLSDYITNLTGISQRNIDEAGLSFPDALASFERFVGPTAIVMSHGGDGNILRENAALHGISLGLEVERFLDIHPALITASGEVAGTAISDYALNKTGPALDDPALAAHRGLGDVTRLIEAVKQMGLAGGSR